VPRRHVVTAAILVAIIVVAAALAFAVQRKQVWTATALAGVAAPPDLSRWPEEFRRVLDEAANEVRDHRAPVAALGRLAELYVVNGFAAQARVALGALRKLEPENPRWPHLFAELAIRENDFVAADNDLRIVVELAPTYTPAWLRLGFLRIKRDAFDEARICFERAVALAPDDVRTRYSLISFEARHGLRGDPRQQLLALTAAHPGIRELHELLAELHTVAGDDAGAAQERQRVRMAGRRIAYPDPWLDALALRCFDSNRLTLLGAALEQQGRYAEAEKLLEHATRVAPQDPGLWDLWADVAAEQGRSAEVRALLTRAVAAAPDDPTLRARLARVLSKEKEFTEGVAVARHALDRWPANAMLRTTLGTILREAGRTEEACAELQEVVRVDATQVEAHYQLGVCRLQLSQRDAGRAEVEKALAMRPDHPEALFVLGGLAIEAGDLATAEPYVSRLYDMRPGDARSRSLFAALHLFKGRAADRAGEGDAAEKLYRAGIAADPDLAPLPLELAQLEERRGHFAAAVAGYESYLRLEPRELSIYASLARALEVAGRPADARRAYERGLTAAREAGDVAVAAEFQRLLGR
jgi:tetratricopeptide (TPR) repeat protein